MPHASSSAATALRDHAERHVFLILPELDAVERRVLALLELADGDRELAARETGLDEEAVRRAAARARKALRRRPAGAGRRRPWPRGTRARSGGGGRPPRGGARAQGAAPPARPARVGRALRAGRAAALRRERGSAALARPPLAGHPPRSLPAL